MTSVREDTPDVSEVVLVYRNGKSFKGKIDMGPYGCDIWWLETKTNGSPDFTLVRETDYWEHLKER